MQQCLATHCRGKAFRGFALALALAGGIVSTPVRADSIDTILKYLATGGIIDKAVVDAKPLIECMLNHPVTECVDLQSAAVAKGQAAAASVLPSDPKLKTAIAVIRAANDSDWFLVLELTSTDLLGQIACDVAMSPTAAVKTVVCGPIFKEVSGMAKPVVKEVIHAFASSPPDIWALVSLVGLPTACEIVPDMPLKDEVCGVLGQALALVTDAAAALANEGWGLVTDVSEVVTGQSDAMPQDQYYTKHWQRWLHLNVLYALQGGSIGPFNLYHDDCVEYFDGHKYSASHAEQVCDAMAGRYTKEVQGVAQAMQAGRASYYQAHIAPRVDDLVLQQYWNMDAVLKSLAAQKTANTPPSYTGMDPLGKDYGALFHDCVQHMEDTYPVGYRGSDPMYPQGFKAHPSGAWGYTCLRMYSDLLAPALQQRHAQLGAALGASGCKVLQQSWAGARAYVECGDYEDFQDCRSLVPPPEDANGVHYCSVNGLLANPQLAKSLATQLGRRCLNPKDNDVTCTRPWRVAECEYLKAEATLGVDNGVYVYCKDVSATDSAYVTGKKLAADVALTLNGGSIQTSSQTYNVFLPPTTNNCYTDWDPLTILCGDPAVLQSPPPAVPASALQKCPPDPNRDGADAACYGGPLYAQSGNQAPASGQPSPGAIAAAGAAAGVAGGGGNARATSVGRPSPPQATRQRDRSARPAAVVADLSELANFSIGGRTASWGSTVTVGGAAGTPVAGGGCRIPVRHFVRNTGPGESGPFTTEWRSSGIRGQVTTSRESLGRGEFRQEMDDVVLIGPVNTLTLVLDPGNQVAESDESNNRYSVTIQLSGTCGARSRD